MTLITAPAVEQQREPALILVENRADGRGGLRRVVLTFARASFHLQVASRRGEGGEAGGGFAPVHRSGADSAAI